METRRMLELKDKCEVMFNETGDGGDCNKCCLCRSTILSMPVGPDCKDTPFENGAITMPVNPCLLIGDLAEAIGERNRPRKKGVIRGRIG